MKNNEDSFKDVGLLCWHKTYQMWFYYHETYMFIREVLELFYCYIYSNKY